MDSDRVGGGRGRCSGRSGEVRGREGGSQGGEEEDKQKASCVRRRRRRRRRSRISLAVFGIVWCQPPTASPRAPHLLSLLPRSPAIGVPARNRGKRVQRVAPLAPPSPSVVDLKPTFH